MTIKTPKRYVNKKNLLRFFDKQEQKVIYIKKSDTFMLSLVRNNKERYIWAHTYLITFTVEKMLFIAVIANIRITPVLVAGVYIAIKKWKQEKGR